MSLIVKVKKIHPLAVKPVYSKIGDAGLDLVATTVISATPAQITYGTGLAFEIPEGYVGLVFPRSSIRNYTLSLSNSVGVIDCVPAGTMIQTPNGEVEIERFYRSPQTAIYSYDEESQTIETDTVSDIWIVDGLDLLTITVETGQSVTVPINKEVYTDRGWVPAGHLTENDSILCFN